MSTADAAAVRNRSTIPFDQLPAPSVIDELDYEVILAELKADLLQRAPELAPALQLESDPAVKVLEAMAYRVLIERQHANEKARRILLAKAKGPELDHLGALPWVLTPRKTVTPANPTAIPPTAAVMESDDAYRLRLQLALEGWSTAGPIGAYLYHALRADDIVKDVGVSWPTFTKTPAVGNVNAYDIFGAKIEPDEIDLTLPASAWLLTNVDDAGLTDPTPGDVSIAVLSNDGDGTPTPALCAKVEAYLNRDALRPTTDRPRAIAAEILHYRIVADVVCYPGPDRSIVLDAAREAITLYTQAMHRCGYDVTISGIHRALHQAGVQRINLTEPAATLVVAWNQAAWCDSITLTDGGVDV